MLAGWGAPSGVARGLWWVSGCQGTLGAGWWDDSDREPWWWGDRVTE